MPWLNYKHTKEPKGSGELKSDISFIFISDKHSTLYMTNNEFNSGEWLSHVFMVMSCFYRNLSSFEEVFPII